MNPITDIKTVTIHLEHWYSRNNYYNPGVTQSPPPAGIYQAALSVRVSNSNTPSMCCLGFISYDIISQHFPELKESDIHYILDGEGDPGELINTIGSCFDFNHQFPKTDMEDIRSTIIKHMDKGMCFHDDITTKAIDINDTPEHEIYTKMHKLCVLFRGILRLRFVLKGWIVVYDSNNINYHTR